MAKEREFSCTIAAPSIINFENHCICQCNVNGQFPIRHWLTLQAGDHISRKCEIWKYVDYHMNIQSIQTSNGFLNISIHIRSCGSDFWKYLLLFSHSNSPKLTGLPTFGQFDHIPRFHSTLILILMSYDLVFQCLHGFQSETAQKLCGNPGNQFTLYNKVSVTTFQDSFMSKVL